MKKTLLFFSMICFAFVLAGCDWFKKNDTNTNGEQETLSGSISELLKSGKSQKCTYVMTSGENQSEVTLYISGDKFRQDIEIKDQNGSILSHMVSDGEWYYSWSTMMKDGSKFKISDMEEMAAENQQNFNGQNQGTIADLDEKFEYKCSSWIKDNSLLTPPKDVNFIDQTKILEDATKALENNDTNSMLKSACDSCKSAPTKEAQDQCRQSLQCQD